MNELTAPDEPLNPYSGVFFALWGLVALFLVGFQPMLLNEIKRDLKSPTAELTNKLAKRKGTVSAEQLAFTAASANLLKTR